MSPATTASAPSRRGLTLTQQIILGLVLGIAAGALISNTNPEWAKYFNPFSQLFLRLHFLTDVLAGLTAGLGLALLCRGLLTPRQVASVATDHGPTPP
jgi:multisubunit Na+/H+ antiporter MnhB subunit